MLQKILTYASVTKKILVIEFSEKETETAILGLEVTQKQGELDISKQFEVSEVAEIPEDAKKATKAFLVLTDSNVLTKPIAAKGTDMEILSQAYPNLTLDDFYYQILKTDAQAYVAICRKEYVHSLIERCQHAKLQITDVLLGNLSMVGITSYVTSAILHSFTATTEIENQQIVSMRRGAGESETYEIEGLKVASQQLLPLATVLSSFESELPVTGNIDEKNQQLQEDHKQGLIFKKMLQYGIGFLLLVLLINFFVFNSSYKTWQQLQEELQVYTTQKERIEKQQSIVSAKENSVQSILRTGFSKNSYYLDQIVQQMPETILLTAFVYQPTVKTIRKDKPVLLQDRTILVTGDSTDKNNFTIWLNELEKQEFIENVTILQYGADKKERAGFEIKIMLTDDTAP